MTTNLTPARIAELLAICKAAEEERDAALAELGEAQAGADRLAAERWKARDECTAAQEALAKVTAERDALRKALEPFADHYECWSNEPDDHVITTCDDWHDAASKDMTVGAFRRASAAHAKGQTP